MSCGPEWLAIVGLVLLVAGFGLLLVVRGGSREYPDNSDGQRPPDDDEPEWW